MTSFACRAFVIIAALNLCACGSSGTGEDDGTGSSSEPSTQSENQADTDTYTPATPDEITQFLGGKPAVLLFVDAGGRIEVLDLREESPAPQLLSTEASCINPIVSPDGSRVIYSRGQANGPKQIFLRALSGGDPEPVAKGDVGYFAVEQGVEYVVYSDWSEKTQNGADGKTYRRALTYGTTTFSGQAEEIHARAMDAGPNRDLSWLGQVYDNMFAFEVGSAVDLEYATDKFVLMGGEAATHQTCNGSMAPDTTARLMTLVIPHDWVRIFTYTAQADRFEETSRFELPTGLKEWEYPEWSTSADYFTAVLRASDRKNRLFIGKVELGELAPALIEVVGREVGPSYSHLWVAQ
jgi:hypothetical protein